MPLLYQAGSPPLTRNSSNGYCQMYIFACTFSHARILTNARNTMIYCECCREDGTRLGSSPRQRPATPQVGLLAETARRSGCKGLGRRLTYLHRALQQGKTSSGDNPSTVVHWVQARRHKQQHSCNGYQQQLARQHLEASDNLRQQTP